MPATRNGTMAGNPSAPILRAAEAANSVQRASNALGLADIGEAHRVGRASGGTGPQRHLDHCAGQRYSTHLPIGLARKHRHQPSTLGPHLAPIERRRARRCRCGQGQHGETTDACMALIIPAGLGIRSRHESNPVSAAYRAGRRARARLVARARRPLVHADSGRPRCRRDQGRATGRGSHRRRRHARLGPAVPARTAPAATPPKPPTTSAAIATSARSRSIWRSPKARPWCARWPPTCDVLVENFKVGDMARYGLDCARLLARATAPRLLLDHRLRPDRPLPRPRRLRLRDPGPRRAR